MGQEKFYIVKEEALSEVLKKVMKVKESIQLGTYKDISQAIKSIGISRSTYYKYKDDIFVMPEGINSKKVTFIIFIRNKPGVLSKVLDCIAFYKGNILTINQDIPINASANVTITIDISEMSKSVSHLAARINSLPNVVNVKLLASE